MIKQRNKMTKRFYATMIFISVGFFALFFVWEWFLIPALGMWLYIANRRMDENIYAEAFEE